MPRRPKARSVPLLDTDNGVFHRDPHVAQIAAEAIDEATAVANRLGMDLSIEALMEQLYMISRRADGYYPVHELPHVAAADVQNC